MTTPFEDEDDEFAADFAAIDAAGEEEEIAKFAEDIKARREEAEHPLRTGLLKVPKNIGIGTYKAIVNTVDNISDMYAEMSPQGQMAKAVGGDELRQEVLPTLSEQYPDFMKSVKTLTDDWERNDTTRDDVTQGLMQFTLPFMGWLKGLGGLKGASTMAKIGKAAAAETATAATAFDPHEGRLADLVKYGAESEGKLGEVLRKLTPDGSLANAYIDYMTSRGDETAGEGRFKNAVDSLVGSAGVAGLLKSFAVAFKGGQHALKGMKPSAAVATGPGGSKQKGMIAFHGTPHDFYEFSLDKVGTGEGAQAYGYGLYFAENPSVAKEYRTAGGPYLKSGDEKIFAEEWDGLPVKGAVKDLYMATLRTRLSSGGRQMFAEREILRNPKKWGLENRKEQLEALELARKTNVDTGTFMTADIDDAAIKEMLDYDKPMSEQLDVLQKFSVDERAHLAEMLDDNDFNGLGPEAIEDLTGNEFQQLIGKAISEDYISFNPKDGNFDNPQKLAAEYLNSKGIPGVRYLDQGSRRKGDGTRNIVLFDDSKVKILKKE